VSDRSPGNYFTYANLNYGVLGTVLEYVTQRWLTSTCLVSLTSVMNDVKARIDALD
jgi:hypothetical protein